MDTRRLFFFLFIAAINLPLLRGQTSVPPLPQLPLTFVFSNCDTGVTYKATITDWLRDANGNVDPLAAMKTVQPSTGTVSYSYLFWGTFTMTVGGTTQVATGSRLPDGSTGRPLGSLGIMYSNLGVTSVPASTTFVLSSSNANGLGVGTGAATSRLAWSATLYGPGDLMPNGVASPLPPISAWTPVNTYIQGDGRLLARPISRYGNCRRPRLGAPSAPGDCQCGDPVNIGTGNLFEQVTDYETAGPNKLAFIRYYNSLAPTDGLATTLGMKWLSNYDRFLKIDSASSVIAERPDGQQVTFTLTAGNWVTDTDVDLKLTQSGATWTLTDHDDTVESYLVTGSSPPRLDTIRARNGYTQTLQYNTANQLSAVADSFHRQLSFTYNSGLLQTVATPDGLTLTYGFGAITGGSRLTSIGYSTIPPTRQTYVYENTALPAALTGIIDENGNRYVTWTYDSAGRALSSQHAGGADLTSIAYNDSDGSRTVTYPLGQKEVYKYANLQGSPKVTEISRVQTETTAPATRTYTYDSNGYLASRTDWNGNRTTYANDSRGQPTRITQAAGTPQARTATIDYHSALHLPVQIVMPGLTITFTYDNAGQLLTRTLTDTTTGAVPYSTAGQTRTWTYTWSNFLPASVKTPRTDVAGLTRYTYDANGSLSSVTNALNQMRQITQNTPGGRPLTAKDANGVVTTLTYDARQRLLSRAVTTGAGILTTSYSYDAAGNLIGITEPDGAVRNMSYDTAHRLTAISDGLKQSIEYTLDASGRRTQMTVRDSGGAERLKRNRVFDALGRPQQDLRGAQQSMRYAYDHNGNLTAVTDPLGNPGRQQLDPLNRLVSVTDTAKGAIAAVYDTLSQLTSVTDATGDTTTYTYNGFGEVIQRESTAAGAIVLRYDSAGNLIRKTDATGVIADYAYDALDRLISITYSGNTTENVTYSYDQTDHGFSIGRLTAVTDAAGTLSQSYDERGNVTSETRNIGSVTLRTAYTYDAASRLASITYPSRSSVAYTRDAIGRVTGVAATPASGGSPQAIVSGVAYQPFGPVSALTYGNGIAEARTFDLDYRLTQLSHTGIVELQKLAYGYDAADNILSITDAVDAAGSQTFSYDVLYRLRTASGPYGRLEYAYDANGNRLTESAVASDGAGVLTTFTYDPAGRLTATSAGDRGTQYVYDGNGNTLTATSVVAGEPGAVTKFEYNQAGRLAAVSADGTPLTQYTYDAFGQRLVKTGSVTATTLYQYGRDGLLLEETDGDGNARVEYIYLERRPIAIIDSSSGTIYFLHTDHLGAPRLATDTAQSVAWTTTYQPFGQTPAVPALIPQNLRLAGMEFDIETGLYHNGFRDYAPGLGRYLQRDPIGIRGGMNTYAYAAANPLRWSDPLGLSCADDIRRDSGWNINWGYENPTVDFYGPCNERYCSMTDSISVREFRAMSPAERITFLIDVFPDVPGWRIAEIMKEVLNDEPLYGGGIRG